MPRSSTFIVACGWVLTWSAEPRLTTADGPTSPATQTITVGAKSSGAEYEGIGALSAGASSRLLIDYPEPARSQVLDLLFRPHFGASLNELKIEIGGDINSTCGAEPSHARSETELAHPVRASFNRGYEWWLMDEARRRNPKIKFGCLEWGAPGWIGNGQFYSADNIAYVLGFLRGAREYHGIEFDYIGLWNERPYDGEYIKMLRRSLDKAGFRTVRIEAADLCCKAQWSIATNVAADPALMQSIGAFGDHYPERVDQAPVAPYETDRFLRRTGKPLWNSEGGPWKGDWDGFAYLAKMYNRDYIVGGMTKAVTWSLITSHYSDPTMPVSGLMTARSPWSGHFDVEPAVWAAAHVTQFVEPGWRYVDQGCGFLTRGGSVVTLQNPRAPAEISIILETIDAANSQTLIFELPAECARSSFAVRRSRIGGTAFSEMPDLQVSGGRLKLNADGGSVYSLSTVHGQQKGGGDALEDRPFPFPFHLDLQKECLGQSIRYFSDQCGAFEVRPAAGGRDRCIRQMVARPGIEWETGEGRPETVFGDVGWRDYSVRAVVDFVQAFSSASVIGRVSDTHRSHRAPEGYIFTVHSSGAWELYAGPRRLAVGLLGNCEKRQHKIVLKMSGGQIFAYVDGDRVASVEDSTYEEGLAGLATSYTSPEIRDIVVE